MFISTGVMLDQPSSANRLRYRITSNIGTTRPRITVAITNDDPNEVTRVSNLLDTARLHGLLVIIYGQGAAPEQVEIDTLKRIEYNDLGIDQSRGSSCSFTTVLSSPYLSL